MLLVKNYNPVLENGLYNSDIGVLMKEGRQPNLKSFVDSNMIFTWEKVPNERQTHRIAEALMESYYQTKSLVANIVRDFTTLELTENLYRLKINKIFENYSNEKYSKEIREWAISWREEETIKMIGYSIPNLVIGFF